ncbi:uncharacterized protein [Battus philenor]|uniref:uncharacterized protein n=1 Tax=Battus philenor TaxID=42288 RepID=UPI0035CF453E
MILYLIQNEIHQVPTSTLNDKDKIAESNVEQPEKDGQENILSIDVNPEHKEDSSDHITRRNEISNKEDESKSISSDVEDDIRLSTVVNMVEKKTKRKLNNEEKQNNEPPVKTRKRRRRKKIRERRQSEKIGECLNEYDEWMRQKNLPLKYFTISNLSKSNNNCASSKMKNATECRNVSEVSQLSKSNNASKDKCPKVLKAFYKNSNPAHYHQTVLSNLVHKISDNKGVKYYLMNNANKNTVYTAVEVQSEADVADITEAVHDREQEKTVIDPEDINRKTIDDVDLQSENGLMVNLNKTQNRNDFNCKEKPSNIEFSPIITSVCSLAETELLEKTAAEDYELLTESLESEIIPPTLSVQSKPNNQSNVSISTSNLSEPILVEHVENESKDKTNVDKGTSSGIISALLNQPPLIGQNNSTSSNRNSQSNATSLKFIQIKAIKTNNGFYLALTPQLKKDQPVLPKHEKPLAGTVPALLPLSTANVPVTVLQKVCTQPATLLLEKKDKVVTKTPCVQVKAWVETRSTENLMILRMDVAQPLFTEKCEYSLITESNLPCKAPTYWSVNHMESRKRILFPSENKGVDVYNPTTVKVYESAANGSTPFANWVKSILRSAKGAEAKDNKTAVNLEDNKNLNVVNDGTESYEPGDTLKTENVNTGEDEAPNLTLKVKSFARINNEDEEMKAPERVSLNGKLYQKVYDQPLKYAQVFTVVSSLEDAQRLSQMNSQFFVLFNGTSESNETIPSPIDNWQQALVPPQAGQVAGRSYTRAAQELSS